MKIAVSMITLDEANYIEEALSSVCFADYLCVVDGGSKDGTVQMIHGAVPKGVELHIANRKWDEHFGNQRQAAYNIIPEDTDWWMRLDADEMYSAAFVEEVRPVLEKLPPTIIAAKIRQTNFVGDTGHYAANIGGFETHARIWRYHRTNEGYHQWVGQVHEYVKWMGRDGLVAIPANETVVWTAQVFHFGWLDQGRRQDREKLYSGIPGSGVTKAGDLTKRHYEIRDVPVEVR
jgi:glycosyltransferase involved in cell wall biosynthesis